MHKTASVVIGAALAVASSLASAALPAEATAAFTSMSSNLQEVIAAVWPMVATATVAFVLIKVFKRGMAKI